VISVLYTWSSGEAEFVQSWAKPSNMKCSTRREDRMSSPLQGIQPGLEAKDPISLKGGDVGVAMVTQLGFWWG
jgi:hypothetical protein